MKWNKGTGPHAAYFIVSECLRWQICKTGEPPIYTLIRMGRPSEIVMHGTLAECKGKVNETTD